MDWMFLPLYVFLLDFYPLLNQAHFDSFGVVLCKAHPIIRLHFYREVPTKDAKEFAESIAAIFIETSARNAVNVEELFQSISKCCLSSS